MSSSRPTAAAAKREMLLLASPAKARVYQRFFKTGKGEYGEGDRFLGIPVPETRKIAKKYRDLSLAETGKLLRSPWHELRLLALVIRSQQYKKGTDREKKLIFSLFLAEKQWINNWDLIDVNVPGVVGHHCYHQRRTAPLLKLLRSPRLWDRRMAVLATFYFICQGECALSYRFCEVLLNDREDLIHKACGWMLREAGKRDKSGLQGFLHKNAHKMPRTMLRYAIEKFSPAERALHLATKYKSE